MIFCSKCGKQLPEGAVFCGECGNRISNANNQDPQYAPGQSAHQTPNCAQGRIPRYYPAYNYESKPKGKGIVVTIITLVIVAALAVGAYFIFWHDGDGSGNRSSGGGDQSTIEKTLEKYAEAMIKCDVDGFMEAVYPEKMLKAQLEMNDMTKSEMKEKLEEYLEQVVESLEDQYGDNLKVDVKILDKEKIDKDELKDEEEEIEELFDINIDIEAGYEIETEQTIKGSDDEETEEETISMYKIDGKWYVRI